MRCCFDDLFLRTTAPASAKRRPLVTPPWPEVDDPRLPPEIDPGATGGAVSAQQYVYERPRARRKNFSIGTPEHDTTQIHNTLQPRVLYTCCDAKPVSKQMSSARIAEHSVAIGDLDVTMRMSQSNRDDPRRTPASNRSAKDARRRPRVDSGETRRNTLQGRGRRWR